MANRYVEPRQQSVDASGDALAGAKLSFFESETTTPRTVYTDVDLTIPHTQPVVADAAGRWSEIFLDGSAYRVQLTDADDVSIYVVDNVFGIPSTDTIQLQFATQVESFTATGGQTLFTLSSATYVSGNNQLQIYINGVYQATPANYTETSSNSFTLTSGAEAGDIVVAIVGTPVSTTSSTFNSLILSEGANLTIAAGVVTAVNSFHAIDTEGAAGTDDLDTINNPVNGKILVIKAVDSARTVVAKDGTGNLELEGDFSLDNVADRLTLLGTATGWTELNRANNGA